MYGDFLKPQEGEISKPPSDPEPEPSISITAPSTTKKKGPGFGRFNGKLAPLRASAVPELSQVYNEVYSDLAKNGRRSHGTFFGQNESHELLQNSNNTIPETLNSSREWNLPGRSLFSSSQNDLRTINESTPMKPSQRDFSERAPVSMDKENFYTPRKAPEPFAASTPAARCPLSALPMDSVPVKDTIDGVASHKSEPPPSNLPPATGFLGSAQKPAPDNIFRTPRCKIVPSQQNSVNASDAHRQRLYGISSSKMLHIPLHPAVAAGQHHAKQLQQQHATEQQSSTSRRLMDVTPLKTAPVLEKQSAMGTVKVNAECQPVHQEGQPLSSNSWIPHSRPVETTPFKAVPNLKSAPLMQAAAQPAALPSVPQPVSSSETGEESASSAWVPKVPVVAYSKPPAVQSVHQKQCQQTPLPQSGQPPSSKRKLEIVDVVQPVVEPKENILQQKLSPAQVREMKLMQCAPKLPEPAKVASEVPRIEVTPVSSDTQPPINSVEIPAKKMEAPIPVVHEPVGGVECPPQQAKKTMEPPAVKVASPAENMKAVEPVKKSVSPGPGGIAVNGRVYTILSLLGRGGSSKVFQVLDPENSQLKAVKCVNLADTDPSICEGYLNEIRLLGELQDGESVIRMFDHEHKKEERLLLVVMEKGDTDLSKLIKDVNKSKRISAAMILYYWTEMLNAVSFIHKRGTIHSDLKPANFLLVSGRLKLIDFGIASSVQEDMTSVVKDCMTGTYNYISPEALSSGSSDSQGFKISYKSDVWSLGCILYSLVYGRTPFQHITGQFQKLNAIVNPNHKIEFPQPSVDGCPSVLIQAMKMCLVRNPKERASVDELLQLPYLEQAGPERSILSQFAKLAASVGLVHETDSSSYAVVIRAMQRLIIENEKHLPFLGRKG